jgi:hypothetical protein
MEEAKKLHAEATEQVSPESQKEAANTDGNAES